MSKRGVSQGLARQVARRLIAKDALSAHARDSELRCKKSLRPVPYKLHADAYAATFFRQRTMPSFMVLHITVNMMVPIPDRRHHWASSPLLTVPSAHTQVARTSSAPPPRLSDILGRVGHGCYSRYRQAFRHHRLKIGVAQRLLSRLVVGNHSAVTAGAVTVTVVP